MVSSVAFPESADDDSAGGALAIAAEAATGAAGEAVWCVAGTLEFVALGIATRSTGVAADAAPEEATFGVVTVAIERVSLSGDCLASVVAMSIAATTTSRTERIYTAQVGMRHEQT